MKGLVEALKVALHAVKSAVVTGAFLTVDAFTGDRKPNTGGLVRTAKEVGKYAWAGIKKTGKDMKEAFTKDYQAEAEDKMYEEAEKERQEEYRVMRQHEAEQRYKQEQNEAKQRQAQQLQRQLEQAEAGQVSRDSETEVKKAEKDEKKDKKKVMTPSMGM